MAIAAPAVSSLQPNFVLATSCELPPRANPDCVKWFMDAAREYGRYDRILGR